MRILDNLELTSPEIKLAGSGSVKLPFRNGETVDIQKCFDDQSEYIVTQVGIIGSEFDKLKKASASNSFEGTEFFVNAADEAKFAISYKNGLAFDYVVDNASCGGYVLPYTNLSAGSYKTIATLEDIDTNVVNTYVGDKTVSISEISTTSYSLDISDAKFIFDASSGSDETVAFKSDLDDVVRSGDDNSVYNIPNAVLGSNDSAVGARITTSGNADSSYVKFMSNSQSGLTEIARIVGGSDRMQFVNAPQFKPSGNIDETTYWANDDFVTKKYVDTAIANAELAGDDIDIEAILSDYLPLSGGEMTGSLTLLGGSVDECGYVSLVPSIILNNGSSFVSADKNEYLIKYSNNGGLEINAGSLQVSCSFNAACVSTNIMMVKDANVGQHISEFVNDKRVVENDYRIFTFADSDHVKVDDENCRTTYFFSLDCSALKNTDNSTGVFDMSKRLPTVSVTMPKANAFGEMETIAQADVSFAEISITVDEEQNITEVLNGAFITISNDMTDVNAANIYVRGIQYKEK